MPKEADRVQPSFKTGDKAVYPGQGVGEVMGIEHTEVAGQRQSFYVLRILENGMRIMIPINKVGSVGLREIISEEDVKQVYAILKEKDISVDSTTWNRRYREYMEKIKTGSVFEIAEVLRDLYLLKGDKDLSFGERRLLDQARSLLVTELALARRCKEDRVEAVVPKAPFKAHEEAAEQFLAFSGIFLLVVAAGLAGGTVGRAARYVSVVGAIGLLAAGVRVGHSGGQLVYTHGAASAYASGTATAPAGDSEHETHHDGTE